MVEVNECHHGVFTLTIMGNALNAKKMFFFLLTIVQFVPLKSSISESLSLPHNGEVAKLT